LSLAQFSSYSLLVAFVLYIFAFILFGIGLAGKRWSGRDPEKHQARWGNIAIWLSFIGFVAHLVYFITRWISSGHIPTANMFEFLTMLAMMVVAALVVLFFIYRTPLLGLFAMPITIILLAYAAVFPKEIQPLIPALQSKWLYIHVTTAALGEAFFAVGFAAGFMYLLRTIDYSLKDKSTSRSRIGIEFTFYVIASVIGFILITNAFSSTGYTAAFEHPVEEKDELGNWVSVTKTVKYELPPLIVPDQHTVVQVDDFLGAQIVGVEAPSWMKGLNSARKLNTILWSALSGLILYGMLRLVIRKPFGAVVQRWMGGIDADDLDEISYRAIAIGYPVFALGALIFAMIWAHEAWGRFWGWDPKETWALITFLFYTVYLHLRLSRGWHGLKSSWMAVLGFLVVMFTLVGVNLIIAGLHSYAGV
jgi:ABC-type transport system involved in cytochrome c biogenesis permease subunit